MKRFGSADGRVSGERPCSERTDGGMFEVMKSLMALWRGFRVLLFGREGVILMVVSGWCFVSVDLGREHQENCLLYMGGVRPPLKEQANSNRSLDLSAVCFNTALKSLPYQLIAWELSKLDGAASIYI